MFQVYFGQKMNMLLATKISFQFLTFHLYISTHLQVMLLDTIINMDLKLYIVTMIAANR